MKITQKYYLLFCFVFATQFVIAQALSFTISLGNYKDGSQSDFAKVMPYGYVYGLQNGSDYAVYIGWFEERAKAEQKLKSIKAVGYPDAKILTRDHSINKDVWSVQIASRQSNASIEWEKYFSAGQLHTKIEGDVVKIMSGKFESQAIAKKHLSFLKKEGFKDGWVKKCEILALHKVTPFEAGMPLPIIKADYSETPTVEDKPKEEPKIEKKTIPVSYGNIDIAIPKMRRKNKRTSVLGLQKVLKTYDAYAGSLDGIYGKGTESGIEMMADNHDTYNKFQFLAQNMPSESKPSDESLQSFVNAIGANIDYAKEGLSNHDSPIAKVYLAYIYLTASDDQSEIEQVNGLMNEAIKTTFVKNKVKGKIPFNYEATYAYDNDLPQLLKHLSFVQRASKASIDVPCWVFERHPKEALASFGDGTMAYNIQNCVGFDSWNNIQTLKTIVKDLQGPVKNDNNIQKEISYQNKRTSLFIIPKSIKVDNSKAILDWNDSLQKGLQDWAKKDVYHEPIVTAFEFAYHLSWIDLEDYFMDKGFNASESKTMALSTLQTIVDVPLQRFSEK